MTGTFPAIWKHAVVHIFKSGDAKETKNYRPISPLPIISKVIEKVIPTQLAEHLEGNLLLSNTPRLETHFVHRNRLYENIDRSNISLLTVCDLSKAFDSVSHEILLKKLTKLKVDSCLFKLLEIVCRTLDVLFRVPQGSALGPVLFLIFVNDLSQYFPDCQYADDTQFIHTGKIEYIQDLTRKEEKTLTKAKRYFHLNGLMLNTNETQCVFSGRGGLTPQIPHSISFRVDDNNITPRYSLKNLGVYFDTNMTFDKHVAKISSKFFSTIMYMNRIKDNFNKNARMIVMQSIVLRIINYSTDICDTTNLTRTQQIQKLQNFAAKVAAGGGAGGDHATPFLE